MSRKSVNLSELDQAALLYLDPKGIEYRHQAGGNANQLPCDVGFLVPISNHSPEDVYFECSVSAKLRNVCQDIEVTEEAIVGIESIIDRELYNLDLVVDKERLSESMEAWVYVKVRNRNTERVPGGRYINSDDWHSAVLIWVNSD